VSLPEEVRRWSDELARDPTSTAFLPLARSYRESGRREAALRLCLRGLERHPHHVEAHVLLGELYADAGEVIKAHDEWDIALSLDPAHLDARRHLGLLLAETGDGAASQRHLRAVLHERPGDAEVEATLARLQGTGRPAPDEPDQFPVPGPASAADGALGAVAGEPGMLGALLVDPDGLLLGGGLGEGGEARAAEVAAALHGAAVEARRALEYLELGALRGVVLETDRARLRLDPVAEALLAVTASADLPLGWLTRRSRQLREVAGELLGGGEG
jgi:tetratricopeptide (TPR) repeat protein